MRLEITGTNLKAIDTDTGKEVASTRSFQVTIYIEDLTMPKIELHGTMEISLEENNEA